MKTSAGQQKTGLGQLLGEVAWMLLELSVGFASNTYECLMCVGYNCSMRDVPTC